MLVPNTFHTRVQKVANTFHTQANNSFLTSNSSCKGITESAPPSPPGPTSPSPSNTIDFSSKAANLEYESIANFFGDDFSATLDHLNNTNVLKISLDTPSSCSSEASPSDIISNSQAANSTSRISQFHKLYSTPEDVYTNVSAPFPYTQGYHSLIAYLRQRFNSDRLLILAKSMAEYRPSFIAATKTLQEDDLIFMEKSFQRTLLEFNKYILSSGTPTIICRRTGQIAAVGSEFCLLTEWSYEDLVSPNGDTKFIIELMDDDSVMKYFEVFTKLAFGDSRGVIMTDCTLLNPSGKKIKTACTWTVKRDVFDIPMMIVTNFLPILD
ncbi:uncharacterized protein SAPINGB_P000010 [Magnusiomyces paraingens]|uniref:ERT1/acuK family PAS domain-containing protein n=1 Tax=Magnusiomyces paraingens TaxID=2606893 RepID=A0A5E8AWF2_9ASCO|nr:uncharacterized protein SAPINGB_P000010 [Saprochaete ingens]VVT43491.1 unnamed protein product [Saprochaete ingens]